MGQFRTRHIRAKYAKLKKKQSDLLKQRRKLHYKTKNWLVANAIVDIEMSDINMKYTKYYETGNTICSLSKHFYDVNSHPFYDATIKLKSMEPLQKKNQLEYMHMPILSFDLKSMKNKKLFGFLFFTLFITNFYKNISMFLSKIETKCSYILISNKNLDFKRVSGRQEGFFVLVKTEEENIINLVTLFEDTIFTLTEDQHSLLFLGLINNNTFYSIKNLISLFCFFRKLIYLRFNKEQFEDYIKNVEAGKKEISEIAGRKDLELTKDMLMQKIFLKYESEDRINILNSFPFTKILFSENKIVLLNKQQLLNEKVMLEKSISFLTILEEEQTVVNIKHLIKFIFFFLI